MSIEIDLHKIQKDILLYLLFNQIGSFSKLNKNKVSNDQFNYHLKRLVELGLVRKAKNNLYTLTTKGKEFANRLDTDNKVYEKQAKIGVLIVTVNKNKYLIQQRLKEPYYGYYGFLTGKIRLGETVLETAARELKEETGYNAKLELLGIKHKMDYSKKGNLLEDKFFFTVKATSPSGKLKRKFKGGKNTWLTESQIKNIANLFDGVEESIFIIKGSKFLFSETKYIVDKF